MVVICIKIRVTIASTAPASSLSTCVSCVLHHLLTGRSTLASREISRHAALDALANLCLKNWAGFTDPQRQMIYTSLTQNFIAHWRAFASPSPSLSTSSISSSAGGAAPAVVPPSSGGGGSGGGGAPAERKVLASATRGLAFAIGKGGVSPVLEPYLARVVHALNHLVQPAGEGERSAAITGRGVSGRSGGGGSGKSTSGSRSRSTGFGGYRGSGSGGGGVSPTRSSASASLADPRARVRLQALTLLESMAAKDPKTLYPHWALFFAPYVPGTADGGGGAVSSSGVGVSGGRCNGDPVLPAGLVSILENDDAPQVRAAAAGAAASLVKNAPLRKWMLLLPTSTPPGTATPSGGGGGAGGIGERVEAMMLRLHRSLAVCLAREKVRLGSSFRRTLVARMCRCGGLPPFKGWGCSFGTGIELNRKFWNKFSNKPPLTTAKACRFTHQYAVGTSSCISRFPSFMQVSSPFLSGATPPLVFAHPDGSTLPSFLLSRCSVAGSCRQAVRMLGRVDR